MNSCFPLIDTQVDAAYFNSQSKQSSFKVWWFDTPEHIFVFNVSTLGPRDVAAGWSFTFNTKTDTFEPSLKLCETNIPAVYHCCRFLINRKTTVAQRKNGCSTGRSVGQFLRPNDNHWLEIKQWVACLRAVIVCVCVNVSCSIKNALSG